MQNTYYSAFSAIKELFSISSYGTIDKSDQPTPEIKKQLSRFIEFTPC